MNSREIVTRAIEFRKPERLPVNFSSFGVTDVHRVAWNQIGTGSRSVRKSLDEWGCTWVRSENVDNMGQVKGHPLQDWAALAHFRWPDPNDPAFYEGMTERFEGSDGQYVITDIFMLLFERMHALHGFTETLADLYLEREKIEQLADRIVEFDLAVMANIAARFPGQIHGFTCSDDWGTQEDTFISPKLWWEFFLPRYARIARAAHAYGWHMWMHSCGKVNKFIPGMLEAGIDVLNLEQPRALGIEDVGSQFAGKVAFSNGCDIQRTLTFADDDGIREEARLLMNCWGTPEGGFILADCGDAPDLGIPPGRKKVAFDAFMEYDRWAQR
jgi:uroporphyrinogen decarboxylase